jgi:hypothetical protein
MQPHSYTELFFLDEATALSAGHRPCAECRNADYKRFRAIWIACFGNPVNADSIDAQLHIDRLAGREKRTYGENIADLPNGTYVALDRMAWLVWGDELRQWSDTGYIRRKPRPRKGELQVLTPRSIVSVLSAGYVPDVHPTVL